MPNQIYTQEGIDTGELTQFRVGPDSIDSASAVLEAAQATSGSFSLAVLLRNLIWSVAALVLILAIIEAVFRAAHVGEDDIVDFAPQVGYFHTPGKLITWRQEGYSQGRHSMAGLRDVEYSLAKPEGVKRIAMIGDSMTESYQVPLADTFAKRLETKLNVTGNGAGAKKVQVMNFGMSGFSTVQQVYLFKEKIGQYKPDVLVLSYHIGDNERNIDGADPDAVLPRPYCILDREGKLLTSWWAYDTWKSSQRGRFFQNTEWLRRQCRIWGVLTRADLQLSTLPGYRSIKQAFFHEKKTNPLSTAKRMTDTSSDVLLDPKARSAEKFQLPGYAVAYKFHVPPHTPAKLAHEMVANYDVGIGLRTLFNQSGARFAITSAAVDLLQKQCLEVNCQLVVLALPANDNSVLYFRELKGMKELAKRDHFLFVNAQDVFPPVKPMEKSPLYYDVHFSPPGHELVAQQLFEKLTRSDLLAR